MRTFSHWVALLGVAAAATVQADPNDFQIYKLGNPTPGGALYTPAANANFRAFARTLGASITSANLMPPETTGHAAFSVNAELSVVRWSVNLTMPTTQRQPLALLMPGVHVRKGLPFSFELGGRVAWLEKSHVFAGTGELKWAALEGFTHLPDVGLRAHVTRLFGQRDFELTTAGLDVGVGKQFPFGGMVTLTPYGGLDFNLVAASAGPVDFRPERAPTSTLTGPDATLRDTGTYEPLRLGENRHTRLYGGVRFIGGVLQLGLEVSASMLGSVSAPSPSDPAVTVDRSIPAVFAFNSTLGLDF